MANRTTVEAQPMPDDSVAVSIVGLLLAAGEGSRYFGAEHKLLASIDGRSVVRRSFDNLLASGIRSVVVVTGAIELGDELSSELGDEQGRVSMIHNPSWIEGQATSLTVGLEHARRLGADFAVIGLGDQPGVPASAWRSIATSSPEHVIVVASYSGRRGPHPVRLHHSLWASLPSTGDDGARSLIREHQANVHEVICQGSAADIDTLEDVQQWKSS